MGNIPTTVYKEDKAEYNAHVKEFLSEASQSQKWWSTLNTSLFGAER